MDTQTLLRDTAKMIDDDLENNVMTRQAVFCHHLDAILTLKGKGVSYTKLYKAMDANISKSYFENCMHEALKRRDGEKATCLTQLIRKPMREEPKPKPDINATAKTLNQELSKVLPFNITTAMLEDLVKLKISADELQRAGVKKPLDLIQYISKKKTRINRILT